MIKYTCNENEVKRRYYSNGVLLLNDFEGIDDDARLDGALSFLEDYGSIFASPVIAVTRARGLILRRGHVIPPGVSIRGDLPDLPQDRASRRAKTLGEQGFIWFDDFDGDDDDERLDHACRILNGWRQKYTQWPDSALYSNLQIRIRQSVTFRKEHALPNGLSFSGS